MTDYLQDYSHKRYNILTGEWVLVSPHRAKRPWQGQEEEIPNEKRSNYDETCYLCPGNERANGEKNSNYKNTYVFTNDFSALQIDTPSFQVNNDLIKVQIETGFCRVICFSPDHSKSLAQMSTDSIYEVVKVWQEEYNTLSKHPSINYIQIFENKGAIMGCSNPHPHGQIWCQNTLPNEVEKKDLYQLNYFKDNSRSLLVDYIKQEMDINERIVFENNSFIVLVPFWAIWPFETMIIPKEHQQDITQMSIRQSKHFADAISKLTRAYDEIFNSSFPYSSGIHQAPTNGLINKHWHWHMSFYPPLLRSATVKKFMVGYEMFGMPQRDITAETASKIIKSLIH